MKAKSLYCLIFILMFSCGNSTTAPGLKAPSSVSYSLVDGAVQINWAGGNADTYNVYVSINGSDFMLLAHSITGKTYTYADPKGDLQFAVASVLGGEISGQTKSPVFSCGIANPKVSRFVSLDSIEIEWTGNENADSYSIFRSESYNGEYVLVKKVNSSSLLAYASDNDNLLQSNTLYYYYVQWNKGDYGYGKSEPVAGIFSDSIDMDEPDNNSMSTLPESTYIYDNTNPPVMFNLLQGNGEYLKDNDWFVYKGSGSGQDKSLVIHYDFTNNSVFSAGDLEYRFYYNGTFTPWQPIIRLNDMILFDNFIDNEDSLLYFLVKPVDSLNQNKIDSYSLYINDQYS